MSCPGRCASDVLTSKSFDTREAVNDDSNGLFTFALVNM